MNFKDKKEKWIEILNVKNIVFNVYDINNRILADMLEEAQTIKKITRKYIHFDFEDKNPKKYLILFKNDLNRRIILKMSNLVEFNVRGGQ